MLISLTPESLKFAKNERHTYQEEVVGMIAQALRGIEAKIQEDLSAAEATVGRSEQERNSREGACAAAETKLTEKKDSAATRKSALATDALDFKYKKAKLKEAEKEQEDGDEALEQSAA